MNSSHPKPERQFISSPGRWAGKTALMLGALLCPIFSHAVEVVVSIEPLSCAPSSTATAWISFKNATGITAADLSLRFPEFVVPRPAETTDASAGFLVASRVRPGHIDIAMASLTALPLDQAVLLGIPLSIDREAIPSDYSMTFSRLQLYNGEPKATTSWAVPGTLVVTQAAADSDGDGLPDDWETAFFGNTLLTGEDDSDLDGVSDAKEFIAGTDPTRAESVFAIGDVAVERDGNAVTLRWIARQDRSYEIEWSDDPFGPGMTWHQVYRPDIRIDTTGARWIDDGTRTYRLPSVTNQRFYRIRTSLP